MRDEDPTVRWPFLWFFLLGPERQGHRDGSWASWSVGLETQPQSQTSGTLNMVQRGGPVKTSSLRLSASCTFTWSCTRPFGGISGLGKGWIQLLKCKLAQLSTVVVSCCAKLLCHLVGVAWSIESRGHPGCLWPLQSQPAPYAPATCLLFLVYQFKIRQIYLQKKPWQPMSMVVLSQETSSVSCTRGMWGSPRLTYIMFKDWWAEQWTLAHPCWLRGAVLIHKFQVSSLEELVGPQHKAAREQSSIYSGWAIITAGLEGPRSRGTHGEVPSSVLLIPLENLESLVPHKLAMP